MDIISHKLKFQMKICVVIVKCKIYLSADVEDAYEYKNFIIDR